MTNGNKRVGRRLSRNNPKYSFDLYKEEQDKLLNLDLDPLLDLIPAYYSDGGRPAQHQALQGREDGKDRKDLLQCLLCVIGNGFPIHDVSHDILCGCGTLNLRLNFRSL